MFSKVIGLSIVLLPLAVVAADPPPQFDREIAPLLKAQCVKCHGPARREAGLNLSTAAGVARGGKKGAVVAPHDIAASKLWERVDNDDMPPDDPLGDDEKALLKRWIAAGAPGLPTVDPNGTADQDHWSFQRLSPITPPAVPQGNRVANDVDRFLEAALQSQGLSIGPEAARSNLIRRVSLDLTGLPPTPAQLDEFLADNSSGAYSRMVERYLASPHYGERWGKYWLDAAGYADSNGYFNADSDRPLAYRYRDYVVRAFNADRPFDRFIREQIAGDELAKFDTGQTATPEIIELLEATHFLRNAQDGSGESDGNPDEVRIDRYTPLEGVMQITSSSLLGLTIQCAKCHSHKFEPISHQDYYQWQAVFYPAFNIDHWIKPNDRVVYAPLPGEQDLWEEQTRDIDERVDRSRAEFAVWVGANRPRGDLLLEESFDAPESLVSEQWSATAPGDDAPGGKVPVNPDSETLPAARVRDGRLQIVEGNTDGSSWLSTKQAFDWTPEQVGESIQVTFDLVDNKLAPDAAAAQRIGYYLALHDFNDSSERAGGNLLIDGNPAGSTAVHLDYPGDDGQGVGEIGTTAYTPGRNYGIRVTNLGDDKYRLEQLVDAIPDDKPLDLKGADLPDGGFGFEYCCGRSFVVDNVRIERFPPPGSDGDSPLAKFRDELKSRKGSHSKLLAEQKDLAGRRPGKIAWATDMQPIVPEVHLLERGNYSTPGPAVEPGTLSALAESAAPFAVPPAPPDAKTSGRRLAWASWVTQPGSRAASLMARVQVNRIWQQHFGTGIVATPENFGFSGAPPSHPELLDWLAAEFIRSGWSVKAIHRLILNSAAFRQSSEFSKPAHETDPDNRLLWRFPVRRLEAEAIRDAMLSVSGDLDPRLGGPYVPTMRNDAGEVLVNESAAEARRRSLYLYQRRTQVLSFLAVFDTPTIVFNSLRRSPSTIPLQSLALLNSDFAVARAKSFAARLQQMEPDESRRVTAAYRLLFAREPTTDESAEALRFLEAQMPEYSGQENPRDHVWQDLCQSLLASNEFLYVE